MVRLQISNEMDDPNFAKRKLDLETFNSTLAALAECYGYKSYLITLEEQTLGPNKEPRYSSAIDAMTLQTADDMRRHSHKITEELIRRSIIGLNGVLGNPEEK